MAFQRTALDYYGLKHRRKVLAEMAEDLVTDSNRRQDSRKGVVGVEETGLVSLAGEVGLPKVAVGRMTWSDKRKLGEP